MKCRILYLIGQLRRGGSEYQLYYLLKSIDRARYQPQVVVWNSCETDSYTLSEPSRAKYLYAEQIQALSVPLHLLPGDLSRFVKLREFRHIVRQLKPEVVHSYSFYTNFAAWHATRGLNAIPIGSIRQDFVSERRMSGIILGRLSACLPITQISNSVAAQKTVEQSAGVFKPSHVRVVQNGIDIDGTRVFPLPQNGFSLLAVGRLDREKRWDRLLRATALLAARKVPFSVRLVGDGPLLKELQSQAKDLGLEGLVQFLGRRDDIPTLLKESNFLIHTADAEGCPNVVLEAMVSGRAVVGTDAGDVPCLVEDGKTGFVVRRGDDAMLVERMATLIIDRDLCSRMGEAGRVKAEREFGLHRLVDETLAAYQQAGWRNS